MIVPDNTVAFYPVKPDVGLKEFSQDISVFLKPLNKDHKRDWFSSHFYHCLPLSIGNLQGFAFSVPFDFEVFWNGGPNTEDIFIKLVSEIEDDLKDMNHVHVSSEFGNGIFTVHFPVILRTPPEVSLMTIPAPNYPIPGVSPMTGVVETDNLRFTFTLNFKIDLPNVAILFKKDYPIMCLLPIPRNFCDSFKLVNAYDIFDKQIVEEERKICDEMSKLRVKSNKEFRKNQKYKPDALYYKGIDVRKNKFKNHHQLPRKNK